MVGAAHGHVEVRCCRLLGPFHESSQGRRASTTIASEEDTPVFPVCSSDAVGFSEETRVDQTCLCGRVTA